MELKKAAELLREFYYEKNGRGETISFLIYILNELLNGEGGEQSGR